RAFLRQFADPHALVKLLRLAEVLVGRAERSGAEGRRVGVLVEMAVAIAIELVIPVRVDNLAGLRIDRHLHRHGDIVLLSIPAAETKNGSAIDAELPPRLVRLLDAYLRVYRPRLAGPDSPWLFAGEDGGRRQTGGFGSQLSRLIHHETGIRMTTHQFRHLGAKVYL